AEGCLDSRSEPRFETSAETASTLTWADPQGEVLRHLVLVDHLSNPHADSDPALSDGQRRRRSAPSRDSSLSLRGGLHACRHGGFASCGFRQATSRRFLLLGRHRATIRYSSTVRFRRPSYRLDS